MRKLALATEECAAKQLHQTHTTLLFHVQISIWESCEFTWKTCRWVLYENNVL